MEWRSRQSVWLGSNQNEPFGVSSKLTAKPQRNLPAGNPLID